MLLHQPALSVAQGRSRVARTSLKHFFATTIFVLMVLAPGSRADCAAFNDNVEEAFWCVAWAAGCPGFFSFIFFEGWGSEDDPCLLLVQPTLCRHPSAGLVGTLTHSILLARRVKSHCWCGCGWGRGRTGHVVICRRVVSVSLPLAVPVLAGLGVSFMAGPGCSLARAYHAWNNCLLFQIELTQEPLCWGGRELRVCL